MEDVTSIHYFIAADVGGTNARFRVVKRSITDETYRDVVLEKIFPVKDYTNIESIIGSLLGSLNARIEGMTLAVAGSKENNCIKVTNVPSWPLVDSESLKSMFKFKQFNLLNDFEANGYGACAYGVHESENLITLQKGEVVDKEPKIILGPGTGLGCALIVYNHTEGAYNVVRGEGGHTEFTATNEQELRLRNFVIEYIKEKEGSEISRVSVERLTAGPAIPLMYEFFQKEHPELELVWAQDEESKLYEASDIVNNALKNKDPLCIKVLDQFIHNLAVFVSDIALVTMCAGGIYLTGGVIENLTDYMLSDDCKFLEIMGNKGRLSEFVQKVPVYMFAKTPGLDGAEQFGLQNFVHPQ
jgi:glucokinase